MLVSLLFALYLAGTELTTQRDDSVVATCDNIGLHDCSMSIDQSWYLLMLILKF